MRGSFEKFTSPHGKCKMALTRDTSELVSSSSVLPKGASFTANSRTKAAVLPKGSSSTATSGTRVAFFLRMNRCGSFALLSAPYSLFSIWTDLKRSEKIPWAPSWRWEEWIWLTGPSKRHWNLPQGLTNQKHLQIRFSSFWTILHQVWQFHFDNISVIVDRGWLKITRAVNWIVQYSMTSVWTK